MPDTCTRNQREPDQRKPDQQQFERWTAGPGNTRRRRTLKNNPGSINPGEYWGLVVHISSKVVEKYGLELQQDDLIAFGMTGLEEAVESFDPARGNCFTTWAYPKIRGRLLDGARAMGWLVRKKRRLKMEEVHQMPHQFLVHAHSELSWAGNPESIVITRQLWRSVLKVLPELPTLQRAVIEEVLDGVSLRSFAKRHRKSPAWASRLRKKSIASIKKLVQEGEPDLDGCENDLERAGTTQLRTA